MKTYRIKTVSSIDAIDWEQVGKAFVDTYLWLDNGYEPKTFAQLVFVEEYGFVVRMTSCEKDPRATHKYTDELVCQDSCMEFFAQFSDTDERYVNIEMNPCGTVLAFIGKDRFDRTSVRELTGSTFEVTAERTDDTWSVTARVPLSKLTELYSMDSSLFAPGYRFRGNFYKCGDLCEIPHYGMWNPVGTESPDFHRPEFFGEFEIL